MSKVTASFELDIKEAKVKLKEIEKSFDKLRVTEKKNQKVIEDYIKQREEATKVLIRHQEAQKKYKKELREQVKSENDLLKVEKKKIVVKKKSTAEIIKQQEAQKKYKKSIREQVKAETDLYIAQNRQIKSIKDLREVTNALVSRRDKLDNTTVKGRKEFEKLTTQINKNTVALKGYDKQIGRSQRNVGNYAGVLGSATAKLFAYTGGVYALIAASKQLIIQSAELSDVFSDIEKTTGLTSAQIRRLDKDLQDLDTRSSRKELLEMSVVAGRMDIAGQDIADFVEVVDKAIVSLKGELDGSAEDIATDLAKMSSVYGFEEKYGVADGINKIGSAINFLGANTKAQAQPMLEFSKRMQGISDIANIGIGDIIGLGASFDELGGNVEVNSTSVNQLLVAMGNKTEEFAKLAGVSFEEFNAILKKDANEALLLFATNTGNTAENIVDLTTKLDGLGLKGKKVVETIGLLSSNTEVFRKNQRLANEEIIRGTSLTDEFNIKNQNLAANLAKIWKNITSSIVTSGLIDGLTSITSLFVKTQSSLEKAQDQSSKSRAEFELLSSTFNSLFNKTNKTKEEVEHLETSYKKLQTLYPNYLSNLKLEKDNYDDIQNSLKLINENLKEKSLLSLRQALELDSQKKITKIYKENLRIIRERQKLELKKEAQEKKVNDLLSIENELKKTGQTLSKHGQIDLTEQERQLRVINTSIGYKNDQLKINKKLQDDIFINVNKELKALDELNKKNNEKSGVGAIFPSKEEYLSELKKIEDAKAKEDEKNRLKAIKDLEDFEKEKLELRKRYVKKYGEIKEVIPELRALEVEEEEEPLELIDIDNLDEGNLKLEQFATTGERVSQSLKESFTGIAQSGLKSFISAGLKGANALETGLNSLKNSVIDLAATLASKAAIFGLLNILSGGAWTAGKTLLGFLGFKDGGVVPTKLAKGGVTKLSRGGVARGRSHAQGGIDLLKNGSPTGIEIEGGEPILTKAVSQSPEGLQEASNLNVKYGGNPLTSGVSHMAQGGIASLPSGNGNSEIMRALNNINRSIGTSANMNAKGQEALLKKPNVNLSGVSNTGIYQATKQGEKDSNQITGAK